MFDRNNIKNAIYWALWKHYNYENPYIYEYGYSKIYGFIIIILKIEKSFVMSRKRKGTWFKESISQRS